MLTLRSPLPGGEVGWTREARQPGEGMNRFKSRSRALRISETAAEALLWRELRNRQLARWKFRRQHPIDRFIVDFVSLDAKLIVEVDDGTHSTDKERARDQSRTRALEQLGFQVMRVTNAEVDRNLDGIPTRYCTNSIARNPSPGSSSAFASDLSRRERLGTSTGRLGRGRQ